MVVEDNKIHIMWLLPQYTIVTIGEILFSITSLEFAYSQGGYQYQSSVVKISISFYFSSTLDEVRAAGFVFDDDCSW